jgi:hypothetical protein
MIPFVNLQAQYRSIKEEVDCAIARVLDSSEFVLGKEVAALEEEFANYLGVPLGLPRSKQPPTIAAWPRMWLGLNAIVRPVPGPPTREPQICVPFSRTNLFVSSAFGPPGICVDSTVATPPAGRNPPSRRMSTQVSSSRPRFTASLNTTKNSSFESTNRSSSLLSRLSIAFIVRASHWRPLALTPP